MSELKPCPFCGSKDVGGAGGIVSCYGCGAETRITISTDAAVILWNTRTDKWISVNDDLPPIGKPVDIVSNGVVQDVVYMLDGADESDNPYYWFEPYYFDHDDNCKLNVEQVSCWKFRPEPPQDK